MIKIVLTGPESTGKSTLAKELSDYYRAPLVHEYARSYLEDLKRPYTFEDINKIAAGQIALEEAYSDIPLLFCDTDMLVCKIWQEYKFGFSDQYINENFEKRHYDLFLLCNTDIIWEYDPLREHPKEREILFSLYEKALRDYRKPYKTISGTGKERLMNAKSEVDMLLSKSKEI